MIDKKLLPKLSRYSFFALVFAVLAVFLCGSWAAAAVTNTNTETNINTPDPGATDPEAAYVAKVKKWQQARLEGLRAKTGWLSLAGLFWLKAGENTFGSDPANHLVISEVKAPLHIGSFFLENGQVRFQTAPGELVMNGSETVLETPLDSDEKGKPTVLSLGTLSWFVIKRDDRIGIRLRDSSHPRLTQLEKIDSYPLDPGWRVNAHLEAFAKPKTIKVPNVLGSENDQPAPGELVFEIKGKTYRLTPLGDTADLFLIFADTTNGTETYGGGRFLSVPAVDKQGNTVIDFNMATCPPCAFSPHATCPMPPGENRLPIPVTAGEKNPAGFKHEP